MTFLPPHVVDKIADPAERKRHGGSRAEIASKNDLKLERELHSQYLAFLKRHEFSLVIHADPTKASRIKPGWPDFSVIWASKILFIEFKVAPNKLGRLQETVIAELREQGCTVIVAYDYEEAIEATSAFFHLNL